MKKFVLLFICALSVILLFRELKTSSSRMKNLKAQRILEDLKKKYCDGVLRDNGDVKLSSNQEYFYKLYKSFVSNIRGENKLSKALLEGNYKDYLVINKNIY